MIHIRIGKKYPPSFSLDVEFEAGDVVTVLFGPGGSGKTCVLEMLAGFVQPDSGRILRDDVLLFDAQANVHTPARRRSCGYVPQRDSLFPHMTARQNLAFAAAGARLERHRRIAEISERFALAGVSALRPHDLSGEQKLRVTLARTLIASPKWLAIDREDRNKCVLSLIRDKRNLRILSG